MTETSESDKVKQAIDLLNSIARPTGSTDLPDRAKERPTGVGAHHSLQPHGRRGTYTKQQFMVVKCYRNVTGTRQRATGACSRAIEAVRSFRVHTGDFATTSGIANEQRVNFVSYGAGKKNKPKNWTIKVVCLSDIDATRVPSTVARREVLVQAGLGEKKVVVPDINCSGEDFRGLLIAAFPKLEGCGGFELLRCLPNSKDMEMLSCAVSQFPKLLKSVVGGGRIFIRPIQRYLQLDLDKELVCSVQV